LNKARKERVERGRKVEGRKERISCRRRDSQNEEKRGERGGIRKTDSDK
jgi:hypothetical protein